MVTNINCLGFVWKRICSDKWTTGGVVVAQKKTERNYCLEVCIRQNNPIIMTKHITVKEHIIWQYNSCFFIVLRWSVNSWIAIVIDIKTKSGWIRVKRLDLHTLTKKTMYSRFKQDFTREHTKGKLGKLLFNLSAFVL